jgi:hypothetical protein
MTKRIFMCSIPCFILFFSLLSPSHAYTPGSVEVTVKDFYTEGPLPGAEVEMEPGGYSDTTDVNGVVSFTGIIPYRNYAVSVSLDGYITVKGEPVLCGLEPERQPLLQSL